MTANSVNHGPARAAAGPVVVKLGGRALEGDAILELAPALERLGAPAVLVHGGGAEVSAWSARLGIVPRFHAGLRVTDDATLEVVAAVLAGLVNRRWVAALAAQGVRAAGLSALDAGIACVVPHPDVGHLGHVGVVTGIDPTLLRALLGHGITPVLASLGADAGQLLNVNADDLAAALAGAMAAPALVLLTDTPGLVLDGAIVPELDAAGLDLALAHPDVRHGMQPKLRAARAALATGAACVWITDWQGPDTLAALLEGSGRGTLLTAGLTPLDHPTTLTAAGGTR